MNCYLSKIHACYIKMMNYYRIRLRSSPPLLRTKMNAIDPNSDTSFHGYTYLTELNYPSRY